MKSFIKFILENYKGEHESADSRDAPLWDLTKNGVYPKDVYKTLNHYSSGDINLDNKIYDIILRYKRKPNADIKIYRAIPKEINDKINNEDWVTPLLKYAKEHGIDNLKNNYKIISKTVKVRDLFTDGNSLYEWGYHPQPYVSDNEIFSSEELELRKQRRKEYYKKFVEKYGVGT